MRTLILETILFSLTGLAQARVKENIKQQFLETEEVEKKGIKPPRVTREVKK